MISRRCIICFSEGVVLDECARFALLTEAAPEDKGHLRIFGFSSPEPTSHQTHDGNKLSLLSITLQLYPVCLLLRRY